MQRSAKLLAIDIEVKSWPFYPLLPLPGRLVLLLVPLVPLLQVEPLLRGYPQAQFSVLKQLQLGYLALWGVD
jgi:hypothetical protein